MARGSEPSIPVAKMEMTVIWNDADSDARQIDSGNKWQGRIR